MSKEVEIPVNEAVEEVAEATAAQESQELVQIPYDKIIKECLTKGWTRKDNIKVKNVNVTDKEEYVMVSFTIIPPIDGYIYDEDTDTYKLGKTNVVFSSTYAIAGAMKEDENLAWLANSIIAKPAMINALMNGGTIDIISKQIAEGEEYVNPFSSDPDPIVFDHDTIINIIVSMELSNNGKQVVEEGRKLLAAQLFGM